MCRQILIGTYGDGVFSNIHRRPCDAYSPMNRKHGGQATILYCMTPCLTCVLFTRVLVSNTELGQSRFVVLSLLVATVQRVLNCLLGKHEIKLNNSLIVCSLYCNASTSREAYSLLRPMLSGGLLAAPASITFGGLALGSASCSRAQVYYVSSLHSTHFVPSPCSSELIAV